MTFEILETASFDGGFVPEGIPAQTGSLTNADGVSLITVQLLDGSGSLLQALQDGEVIGETIWPGDEAFQPFTDPGLPLGDDAFLLPVFVEVDGGDGYFLSVTIGANGLPVPGDVLTPPIVAEANADPDDIQSLLGAVPLASGAIAYTVMLQDQVDTEEDSVIVIGLIVPGPNGPEVLFELAEPEQDDDPLFSQILETPDGGYIVITASNANGIEVTEFSATGTEIEDFEIPGTVGTGGETRIDASFTEAGDLTLYLQSATGIEALVLDTGAPTADHTPIFDETLAFELLSDFAPVDSLPDASPFGASFLKTQAVDFTDANGASMEVTSFGDVTVTLADGTEVLSSINITDGFVGAESTAVPYGDTPGTFMIPLREPSQIDGTPGGAVAALIISVDEDGSVFQTASLSPEQFEANIEGTMSDPDLSLIPLGDGRVGFVFEGVVNGEAVTKIGVIGETGIDFTASAPIFSATGAIGLADGSVFFSITDQSSQITEFRQYSAEGELLGSSTLSPDDYADLGIDLEDSSGVLSIDENGELVVSIQSNIEGVETILAATYELLPADDATPDPDPEPEPEPEPEPIEPTEEDDLLDLTEGSDTIDALGGDDTVYGRGGDDEIIGGLGDDDLRGGDGNDRIGAELDLEEFEESGDADSANFVRGNAGDDFLFGGFGADDINGGFGDDYLFGKGGDDKLGGFDGHDLIIGGGGDDAIHGGDGSDEMYGGEGDDIIRGADESDLLDGGEGDDTLVGGAGADEFVIGFDDGPQTDVIKDFTLGEDTLTLFSLGEDIEFGDLMLSQEQSTAIIEYQDTIVRLNGVDAEDLSEADITDF